MGWVGNARPPNPVRPGILMNRIPICRPIDMDFRTEDTYEARSPLARGKTEVFVRQY